MTQEDPYVCFGRKERVMVTLWEKFGEPPNLVDANWWFGGMRSAHEEGDSQPRGARPFVPSVNGLQGEQGRGEITT